MKFLKNYSIIFCFCLFSTFYATTVQSTHGRENKYIIDLGSSDANKIYRVIFVNGDIYIENGFKRKVKIGDILLGNMKITAKTKDVSMRVYGIDDSIGSQSLSPMKIKKYNHGKIDTFLDFLKAYFIPSPKIPATRGGYLNNEVDIFNHFRATTKKDIPLRPYLVLGKSKIYIAPEVYSLTNGSCFFIRYTYNDEKIDKKFPSQGNYIFISRDDIYRIDGKSISGQDVKKVMEVYYYDSRINKSIHISGFYPVFPDEEKLKKQISVLVSAVKDAGRSSEIFDEVLSFLDEFYGTPYRDNVKTWLEKNFSLKIN